LVVGGAGGSGDPLADGAAYDCAARAWWAVPRMRIAPRLDPSVAWTGRVLLVWGGDVKSPAGSDTDVVPDGSGAAYDPDAQTWRVLPPAPIGTRARAISAWTGRELLVLGGEGDWTRLGRRELRDGALFDPLRSRWRDLAR